MIIILYILSLGKGGNNESLLDVSKGNFFGSNIDKQLFVHVCIYGVVLCGLSCVLDMRSLI